MFPNLNNPMLPYFRTNGYTLYKISFASMFKLVKTDRKEFSFLSFVSLGKTAWIDDSPKHVKSDNAAGQQ